MKNFTIKKGINSVRNASKLLLLTAILMVTMYDKVNASHVVGSDITYKCTSTPGVYEVTFVFYRSCTGIPVCPGGCGAECTRTLQILGADPSCANTNFGSFDLSLQSVRDVGLNPDCPTAKSICTNMDCVLPGTYTPAIERYEFKGFANIGPTSGIPPACCNVRFAFSESARNSEINTGAANQNFYIDAVINRCLSVSPCNSSPELTNDPFAVMCGGENYIFNNGAIDPDYDSLSFAFAPALQSFGASVTYDPPFAYNKPMPWTGNAGGAFPAGIRCDPETGDIMFTPGNTSGQNFYGIMCIEVKQWKTINGIPTVIGTTRRDIQMVVLANCPPNNPPRFVTNPPQGTNPNAPKFKWDICAGEQLCFTITAKDTDMVPISDTTYLSWNGAIASLGATFLPTYNPANRHKPDSLGGGPREDQYQFCWTPGEELASNTPYYFTISAKDSRCPNPGRITRAFSVKVFGRADLDPDPVDLKCGKFQIKYTDLKPSRPPQSVLWQISRVPGDWSMTQNPYISTSKTPFNLTFGQGGKYLVILQASTPGPNGVFCTRTFYDTIVVDTNVQALVLDTFTCVGSTVQISASAKNGTPTYTYRWYNSIKDTGTAPLNGPVFTNPNFTVAPSATRYYTVQVRDLNLCRSIDSVKVTLKQLPISILSDSSRICYGDTFTLDPGNNGGNIKKYLWSTGDTSQTISRMDSGMYRVSLTDTFNCVRKDTLLLYVNSRIYPNAGIDTILCSGDTATLRGSGGHMYQWRELSTGSVISAKGYNPSVRVHPTNTSLPLKYEVRVYQSYPDTSAKYKECSVTDTMSITVKPLPVLIRPQATPACKSEGTVNLPGFQNNQPNGVGVWSYPAAPGAIILGTTVNIDSLKNIPLKDTMASYVNWVRYKYTAPLSFGGCSRTDSANITIYGNPPTNAGKKLIWCENGGIYPILTGANNQNYSPSGGNSADGEEWTGPGIYSQTVITTKRWYFNPLLPGVPKLPALNIVTYKYTRTYPGNVISCSKEDTVQFNVTDPPEIDAGNDVLVCKNEPIFNISTKAVASISPNTGKTYWTSSTASLLGTAIVNGQQDFNASASSVVVPGGSPTVSYKMYISDTSSGCTVRDSMTLRVARVPVVDLIYDKAAGAQQSPDSINVCQNTKQVYFRIWATSSTGLPSEPSIPSWLDFAGSSTSFGFNTNTGLNTSRGVFNSTTAAPGIHKLKVKYTDNSTAASCSNVDSNIINVLEPPTIQAIPPDAICAYDAIALVSLTQAPNAGYKFKWTTAGDGTFPSGSDTLVNSSYAPGSGDKTAGKADLTVTTEKKTDLGTNGDQCAVASWGVTLLIDKAPDASIIASNVEGCVPLTSNYAAGSTGVSNAQFKWEWENEPSLVLTDSAISRTVSQYNTQVNGLYRTRLTVSSTVNTTCSTTTAWSPMTTHAIPVASFVADPPSTTIAKPFFNFINTSTVIDGSVLNYLWNLGPGPDLAFPEDRYTTVMNPTNVEYSGDTASKEIWLKVTSEYGCVDSTSNLIRIEPDITVFIPNAFRPNSPDGTVNSAANCLDGEPGCNKKFFVVANGHATVEIFIYNRWGQLVYKSTNAAEGWDGTVMNLGKEFCQQEVYVYQVNATSYSGKAYKYSGSVTLLR